MDITQLSSIIRWPYFQPSKDVEFTLIEKLIIWQRDSAYEGVNKDDKHILPYSMSKYDEWNSEKGKLKQKGVWVIHNPMEIFLKEYSENLENERFCWNRAISIFDIKDTTKGPKAWKL